MDIKVKCPCETDVHACCACVSMHCDKCHGHSKFQQGRYCSHCGRPLKAELKRNYVPVEEVEKLKDYIDDLNDSKEHLCVMLEESNQKVEKLEQDVTRLVQEKDNLIKNYAECMKYYAREIFEEISQIKKDYASGDIDGNELYVRLYLLEKKCTEEKE